MSRPDNGRHIEFLPIQKKSIMFWPGAKADIPAGFAPMDGGTYNGTVTPDITDRALEIAGADESTFGQINNVGALGNDLIDENSFTFSSAGSNHTHESVTEVRSDTVDGGHTHGLGTLQAGDFKRIRGQAFGSNSGYISNGTLIIEVSGNSDNVNDNGKALSGTFEDISHSHRIRLNNSARQGMVSEDSPEHVHDIDGGDPATVPATFCGTWLLWVGYS